jgi:3-isopropylmalate dehydratase small subunit
METGWEKLKLVQFFKMTKNLTPHYISCLVPQAFANIHDNNTRNASALPVVRFEDIFDFREYFKA